MFQEPLGCVSMTPDGRLVTPFEFGPFGLRGAYVILGAIIRVAEDAKKLFELAARKLGCDASQLDTAYGLLGNLGEKARINVGGADLLGLLYGYGASAIPGADRKC